MSNSHDEAGGDEAGDPEAGGDGHGRPDTPVGLTPGAAHATRPFARPRRLAAILGGVAALVAVGLGTAALLKTTPSGPTASSPEWLTATPNMPIPATEILTLLDAETDLGTLAEPRRRASCLTGLGYPPDKQVLGAKPTTVDGKPGVLLVLPAEQPDALIALVVAPNCNAADTGLLADTLVRRP